MQTYHRKPYAVQAVRISEPKYITTSKGSEYFHVGDWLVADGDDLYKCADWIFKLKFELAMPPGC